MGTKPFDVFDKMHEIDDIRGNSRRRARARDSRSIRTIMRAMVDGIARASAVARARASFGGTTVDAFALRALDRRARVRLRRRDVDVLDASRARARAGALVHPDVLMSTHPALARANEDALARLQGTLDGVAGRRGRRQREGGAIGVSRARR